jgi:ABC-type thiamine transport system substrate-binding protein
MMQLIKHRYDAVNKAQVQVAVELKSSSAAPCVADKLVFMVSSTMQSIGPLRSMMCL